MDATREAMAVSVAIGFCMAGGLLTAYEEWKWLRATGRLTPEARGEMLRSLSLVPPNVVVSILAGGLWAAAFLEAQARAWAPMQFGVATTLAAFVACDFSYYWEHRCAHRV